MVWLNLHDGTYKERSVVIRQPPRAPAACLGHALHS